MKKLITVVFSVCMVLSIVFSGCAGENNAASYAGYAYDLYAMEEIADLDNFYAGLVRDITEIVNSETLQFGFVISDSISQLDRARNAMESIVPSEN